MSRARGICVPGGVETPWRRFNLALDTTGWGDRMQILMDFLQLTEAEAQALAEHAPELLRRAHISTRAVREQVEILSTRGGMLDALSSDQCEQLVAMHQDHYRELLAPQYTLQLQHRMVEVGDLYYQWGVSPLWIMTTSSLFAADFEAFATDLSLSQRRPLMAALYKRLRRDEVWQMEGYRYASDSVRRKLERSPLRDSLTGLLNRSALDEMLPTALDRARRNGTKVVVARLDFDAFRSVNDTHGTALGDLVLQQLADRLRRALRKIDLVARLDSDDFVLVLEDIHRIENIAPLLERLQLDLDVPYTLSDTLLWQCPISMGITLYPDDNVDAQGLLRHTEQVLREVKANKAQRECFWAIYGQ